VNSFPSWTIQEVLSKWEEVVSVTCDYGGEEVVPGQRIRQGRGEYLILECPIPTWLKGDLDSEADTQARDAALLAMKDVQIRINVYVDPIAHAAMVEDREAGLNTKPTLNDSNRVLLVQHDVLEWDEPKTEGEFGICVSPLRFNAHMTMTDIIEWRQFHAYQGFDIVHWYTRDPEFHHWVDVLNKRLGYHDTVLDAPKLSTSSPIDNCCDDQALWYADCLMRYGQDEWQAYIDIDEYLFPTDNPIRNGTKDRLLSFEDNIGSVAVNHVYYGGDRYEDVPELEGFDRFPRNAYTHWQPAYLKGKVRWTKSIYRPKGMQTLWVHFATERAWRYGGVAEVAGDDTPGVLQVLHSRRQPFPDIEFPVKTRIDTPEWTKQWRELAKDLEGLEDLHVLEISSL